MGTVVGELLQDAQAQILEQHIDEGCNAVLGMTFNVTNDSSGKYGNFIPALVVQKMCARLENYQQWESLLKTVTRSIIFAIPSCHGS